MAFTVEDFEDLVRLLEQRPEWRARLRDLLLPREILELPATVARLAESVAELVEMSRAALARLDRVEERLTGVERRLTGVETGVQQLTVDMGEVKAALRRLDDSVGELRGTTWEYVFRASPEFWFSTLIAQPVALSRRQIEDLLRPHVSEGRLTPAEASHISRTDLVIAGSEDGEPAYLVIEVSRTVSPSDVQRAADRTILFRGAIPRVRAVAAGKLLRADAAELAQRRGVVTEAGEVVEHDPTAD